MFRSHYTPAQRCPVFVHTVMYGMIPTKEAPTNGAFVNNKCLLILHQVTRMTPAQDIKLNLAFEGPKQLYYVIVTLSQALYKDFPFLSVMVIVVNCKNLVLFILISAHDKYEYLCT